MAIRGETLGEAFVRVHADTSLMHRELQAAASGAGRDAGDTFGTDFFERVQASIRGKSNRLFEDFFSTGNIEPFIKQFRDVDDAIADIQDRMQDLHDTGLEFGRGGALDQLGEALDRAFEARHINGAEALARELTKVAEAQGKISPSRDIDSMERYAAALTKADRELESYARNLTRAAEAQGKWSPSRDAVDVERYASSLTRAAHAAGDFNRAIKQVGDDDNDTLNFLQRFRRDADGLGNTIGRLFGRGSRNNFLNFFGSVVTNGIDVASAAIGGLVDVIGNLPRAFRAIQDSIGNVISGIGQFTSAIADANGVGAKFAAAGGQILGGLEAAAGPAGLALSALVVAVVAATAVFGGLTFALGALGEALAVVTAAASLLLGGVVAVAGAVETALIGALVVATPLMAGLAAGVATLVVALTHLSDAQKNAFKPLGDQFKQIGDRVAQTFLRDIPIWIGTASNLLTTFAGPTMQRVASDIRDAVTGIARDFEKPEIKRALDAWSAALGPIAGNLTTAFGKALEGALAFFAPVLPLAVQLSESIEKVATQFTNWATSAAGQNAIKDFFTQAWREAETLFNIVVNLGSALQTVFNAGNQVGSEFLNFLESKTKQLQNFLKSAEGQNQLAEWFQEAKRFGENLWTTLEKIFGALSKLNTPQAREFANKLVIAFGRLADIIGALSPLFDGVGKAIAGMLRIIAQVAGGMLQMVGNIATAFSGLFRLIGHAPGMDWATQLADDLDKVAGSADAAGKMLSGLPDQVDIDFAGDTTDMILAAQEAAGIVDAQDGSKATTLFGGDTDPLKTAIGDARGLIDGGPQQATIQFKGDLGPLIADAAGATAIISNFNQGAVKATVIFDGDTLPLIDDINKANALITKVKPTYETEFGGDTSLLTDATVNGNDIIEAVHPEWLTTFFGDSTPINEASIQATGGILDVPIDWTTFFFGDVSALTTAQAQANDEIIQVPADWNTAFGGDTGLLMDATVNANEVIATVFPFWETAFEGDTGALLDSTEAANAFITGVHDFHSTEFGGDTGALLDATIDSNAFIGTVQDLNLTTFTGDNNPLNNAARLGNQYIDGVHDFNTTTFDGNPAPLQGDARTATGAINGVPDSNTTTFYGDTSPLIANIRRARAEISALLAFNAGALGNADLGQRARGGIVGMAGGSILRGPQVILAGEAGPEAIVPLRRSLSQVDPSVRALSAIAQGLGGFGNISEGAIVVNSNFANPHLVAEAVLDRLVLTLNG